MIFALAGNQNCGKTTLFNQLTGSNQHVGNFPGVTVDQKVGQMKSQPDCSVVDLPGIYSLRPYTNEEIVTRDFLLNEKPDGIINIVDATNIERNLYLTLQLMEMRIPMVLALNMMDEVRGNGGTIHINKMESMLGIPVIPISYRRQSVWQRKSGPQRSLTSVNRDLSTVVSIPFVTRLKTMRKKLACPCVFPAPSLLKTIPVL